uniref:Rho-related GTP-binding protein RhoU n=1 Tax=Steinernema glaseri TaxID=37863 RepID=A0A1I7YBI7_9BILA
MLTTMFAFDAEFSGPAKDVDWLNTRRVSHSICISSMMKKSLKLVVVGDGACGKTSLILAQSGGPFSEDYTPTAFDDYAIEALINGKTKILTVCDTAGEDDFSSLRPLSYPDTDVFILCYSVERPESIRRLRDKWIPEIKQFCPHTPMLIVGNKKDIRDEVERRHRHNRSEQAAPLPTLVDLQEAAECAQEFSTFNLIECSAKTREGVRKVFETAISAAMTFRSKQSNKVIESIMKLKLVF